jgi:CRISPR system Cascade subunit CasE
MYLSKLVLNPRKTEVLRDLSNAHKLHQRIMQAFPDEENRDHPREGWHILFRQEPDSDIVLVQSEIEPDWSKLPDGYWSNHNVKPVTFDAAQFGSGRILQFRLRANPSKRDKETRKTIGLFRQADQLAWLERQADRCGFKLHGVDVIPSPNVFGIKGKGSPPIRITTALYQGILEVTDPNQFLNVLRQGIGRGKSYGCGLLSVARFQS